MGSHVSAVPNHQVHRSTPLRMRGHVATMGNLGYELDLTRLPQAELDEIAAQVARYKGWRRLVQFGDFIRLQSPFEGDETSWLVVDAARDEALLMHARTLCPPQQALRQLRLRGLDPAAVYRVRRDDDAEGAGRLYGGDELMHIGLPLPVTMGDYQSWLFHLIRT
jgi:alpha-galactosidase